MDSTLLHQGKNEHERQRTELRDRKLKSQNVKKNEQKEDFVFQESRIDTNIGSLKPHAVGHETGEKLAGTMACYRSRLRGGRNVVGPAFESD